MRFPMAVALALAVITVGCLGGTGPSADGGDPGPVVAFNLTDLDGISHTRAGSAGTPVLLFMMATWCPTCQREAPHLGNVHGDYGDRVDFFTVDIDTGESEDQLRTWKDRYDHPWPHAFDTDALAQRTGTRSTSTVVFLDGEGRLAAREYAPSEGEVREILDALLT